MLAPCILWAGRQVPAKPARSSCALPGGCRPRPARVRGWGPSAARRAKQQGPGWHVRDGLGCRGVDVATGLLDCAGSSLPVPRPGRVAWLEVAAVHRLVVGGRRARAAGPLLWRAVSGGAWQC